MEGGRRDEDQKQRRDRELIELLNELRVAIPGVQILFAFLLTVPFTQRFAQATTLQRNGLFVSLVCAAIASVLLIAPSAQHRLLFRQSEKETIIEASNRQTVAGLVFLAIAMTAALLVVTDVLFSTEFAVATAAVSALLFALVWFALPLARRRESDESDGD